MAAIDLKNRIIEGIQNSKFNSLEIHTAICNAITSYLTEVVTVEIESSSTTTIIWNIIGSIKNIQVPESFESWIKFLESSIKESFFLDEEPSEPAFPNFSIKGSQEELKEYHLNNSKTPFEGIMETISEWITSGLISGSNQDIQHNTSTLRIIKVNI